MSSLCTCSLCSIHDFVVVLMYLFVVFNLGFSFCHYDSAQRRELVVFGSGRMALRRSYYYERGKIESFISSFTASKATTATTNRCNSARHSCSGKHMLSLLWTKRLRGRYLERIIKICHFAGGIICSFPARKSIGRGIRPLYGLQVGSILRNNQGRKDGNRRERQTLME